MDMRIKPLMIAVTLALGASGTAFAQAGSGDGSGGNTNSVVKQPAAVAPDSTQSSPNMDNNANRNTNSATGRGFDNDTRINGQAMQPKSKRAAKSKDTTANTTGNAQLNTGKTGEGTNAFDTDTKINGTPALPGASGAKSKDADDHTSAMSSGSQAAMNNAETQPTPTAAEQHMPGMSDDTQNATTKTHKASGKKVGHTAAGKAKPQNSTMHRTDEPFRDDVGRLPGANPETPASSTTTKQ